ncbi:PHP domain-containing protein [Ruminococcaceae bacterium OttesenSCG-928-I18]|nr:PHP domain-containing protein [Ruminococcaceae bacterium OttesenSCG-928-I18]
MLVDLHMHESTFSKDSALQLEEMVAIAKKLGLGGICITDHDSLGLRKKAGAYSAKIGYPIFVGVEYNSLQGDIVAFGIDCLPERRVSAQDFIDYVHRKGGICFSAHPYRDNNRGLGRQLANVKGLDGIEAFNASTSFEANRRAFAYCVKQGIQPLGVSDCHVKQKIGTYATCLPDEVTTLEELIHSIKKGQCYPVGYFEGEYINLAKASGMFDPASCLLPAAVTGAEEEEKTIFLAV